MRYIMELETETPGPGMTEANLFRQEIAANAALLMMMVMENPDAYRAYYDALRGKAGFVEIVNEVADWSIIMGDAMVELGWSWGEQVEFPDACDAIAGVFLDSVAAFGNEGCARTAVMTTLLQLAGRSQP